ncbi:hypothetical protein THAOC_33868, partial [Thalassiosira oceanica]
RGGWDWRRSVGARCLAVDGRATRSGPAWGAAESAATMPVETAALPRSSASGGKALAEEAGIGDAQLAHAVRQYSPARRGHINEQRQRWDRVRPVQGMPRFRLSQRKRPLAEIPRTKTSRTYRHASGYGCNNQQSGREQHDHSAGKGEKTSTN